MSKAMGSCCCTQHCNDMTETLVLKVFYLKTQILELKFFKLLKVRITQQWNAVLRAYETTEKQQNLQEKRKTITLKNINLRIWVKQLKFVPTGVVPVSYTHWTEPEPWLWIPKTAQGKHSAPSQARFCAAWLLTVSHTEVLCSLPSRVFSKSWQFPSRTFL